MSLIYQKDLEKLLQDFLWQKGKNSLGKREGVQG